MGMIDAKQAKDILGCDDATLQQHVNSGAIKAQRQGGKLMVEQDDVQRLAHKEDEEGTIVLTGESDNLQIDLGKVVDDSSETIVQSKAAAKDSQQITFGEDLEVVSLDDSKSSSEVATKATAAEGLSFTDSNTAVMTSVDETQVGATTAPIDTGPQQGGPGMVPNAESGRRSVRSSRRLPEREVRVHVAWLVLSILTFVVGAALVAPYYALGVTPTGDGKHGTPDKLWSGLATGLAGFSVEPNETVFRSTGNAGEYKDIKNVDPQAVWRYKEFLGTAKDADARMQSFIIDRVSDDGQKAISKGGVEYPLVERADKVKDVKVWADAK